MADVVQAVLTATDRNYTSTIQKAMGVTDSFASKLKSGVGFGAWVAIGTKAVNTVFNAIGNGVDGAVKRFDTLNNFPKVMQSLGFEAEDAQKGIDRLADGIDHLPTTLDAVASQAQQFVPMTGNIEKATDVTLALNNAMAAGGKDAGTQQRAIEQWTKAMAKGKPDFEMWQSMVQTAPAQMDQLAKAMLGADANQNDLYESMKNGSVSIEEVNDKMIELTNASDGFDIAGKHYDNFAVQAENASAGIGMAMVNTNAAVQRNIEKIIRSFDKKLGGGEEGGLVSQLMKLPDVIDAIGGKITEKIDSIESIGSALATVGAAVGAMGLAPVLSQIATGLMSVNKAIMGVNFATAALGALSPAVLFGAFLVGVGLLSTAFGDEIDTLIADMTTKGPEIITSLGEGITSRLPDLMAKGAETLTNFINGIAANIPAVIQQGTNILTTLVQGVIAALPQLIPAAFNAIGQFLIGIANALPQLITTGLQLIVTLVQGISQNFPQLLTSALTAIAQFALGIVQNLPQIIQAGFDILQSLIRGIIDGIVHIPAAIQTVFTAIKDAITGNKSDLESSGEEQGQTLVDSVADSASSNASVVESSGRETAQSFGMGVSSSMGELSVDLSAVQAGFDAAAPPAGTAGTQAGTQFATNVRSSAQKAAPAAQTAGRQTGQRFASGVRATQGQVTSAATAISNATAPALRRAAPIAQTAGSQVGQRYASGVRSAQGSVSSASSALSSAATSSLSNGYGRAYSAGASISQGMASGMWSAVGSVRAAAAALSAAADEAMRAKARIHSPSKVTKKTGAFIGQGLVAGILGKVKAADKAGKKIVGSMLKTMKAAAKTGKYESVGKTVNTKIANSIKKSVTAIDNAIKSSIKKIDAVYDKGIRNTKNDALKDKWKKQKDYTKTQLQNLQKVVDKAYDTQIKNTEKRLTALAKKYQEKYDEIIRAQSDFTKRLTNVELFRTKNGKVLFFDFKAETTKINTLSKNIEKLKKILPRGLMDEIISMDTADALKYTNAMLQMSTSQIKAYGKTYTTMQKAAKSTSKKYYAERVNEVKTAYTKAVEKEFKTLKTNLAKVGMQAVQGFANGMKKNKKKLDAVTRQIANGIIATAKKTLKIKSPSRVFEQIGAYTGEGFIVGLDKTQSDVQASINNMLSAADFNRQMANNRFNGSLSDEYDYNIAARYEIVVPLEVNGREFARATANDMQAVINQNETYANRKRGIR